eukprot:Awhi_evm1s7316
MEMAKFLVIFLILVVKTILFAFSMTLVSDVFFGPLRITYTIRLSITYPSTLNNLSATSNLVSTCIYTSTTLTYSSQGINFITSTTTTRTALSYNHSNSHIQRHNPTLFPTFTSLKSEIQSYQSLKIN